MPSGVYKRTDKMKENMSKSHVGQTAWNKGKKLSEEHIEKLRTAKLGKPRAGNPENWKHSDETKAALSEMAKGHVAWNKGLSGYTTQPCSEERKQKISIANKGKKGIKGEKNHLWRGGITKANTKIRKSTEYKNWRISVFERDDYTCQECGEHGCELNADHIKPFALFPEHRLDIDNGRTLCVPCHKETDTYLWKSAPQVINKTK